MLLADHVWGNDGNNLHIDISSVRDVSLAVYRLTVFQSQLDAVDKATPRERIGSGKISPMTIHAPGPQVEAKKKMKIAMNAIWAFTAEMLSARLTSGSLGSG